MSVPYHIELAKNNSFTLMMNIANIKNDIPDENIELHFYAIDSLGSPIFNEEFDVEVARIIYRQLNSISVISDCKKKSGKIVEVSDVTQTFLKNLKDDDIEIITKLFAKFDHESKVKGLLNSLSDLEIENLHGAYFHRHMKDEISNLLKLIHLEKNKNLDELKTNNDLKKYNAKQPEKIFQNWIEENLWIFGVEYIKKHDFRKISPSSEADLLMESSDGYLDLIELKRPSHNIFKYDSSHKSYYPHNDLSIAIGQCLFYLQKMEEYKLNIEKDYKVKIIMPRIKLIIGNSDDFDDQMFDALRILNSSLNNVQILTYSELVSNGNTLLTKSESPKLYE